MGKAIEKVNPLRKRVRFTKEFKLEAVRLLELGQKSVTQLALELGRQVDVPLPTTSTTNEFLTAARAMGLAERDFAIVFEALARMAGVSK